MCVFFIERACETKRETEGYETMLLWSHSGFTLRVHFKMKRSRESETVRETEIAKVLAGYGDEQRAACVLGPVNV